MVTLEVDDSQTMTLIPTLEIDVGDTYEIGIVKSFHLSILHRAVAVEGLPTDCLEDQYGRG